MEHCSEVFVGIDVAKARNAIAVADGERAGEARFIGEVDAAEESMRRVVKRIAASCDRAHFCYEAGPTGYGLHRLITSLGHPCTVVAPSLIPRKPGDRVKTIHGVGVFAIRAIPAGTNIFSDDPASLCWVAQADVERLPASLRKLYTDFCVFRDGKYGVPEHFSRITPGWYLNEPVAGDEANVLMSAAYDLIAGRDIREGEELIRRKRVQNMRAHTHWRWHLDEVYVKINGQMRYLWRAVDHEGEVLESFVTTTRDKAAALKFIKKMMKRHGRTHAIVTDRLRSYGAALKEMGATGLQETGRRLNNRAENSHQPFRRRERAMERFRRMKTLQKFSSVHAQVHNHFNQERHLVSREIYKQRRSAALAEWRSVMA